VTGLLRAPTLASGLAMLVVAATAARAQEQPPAPPSRNATTVTAPPSAPSTPREDSSAAASVILPSESPRAYDDLGTLLLEVPGVVVARTGSTTELASLALRGSNPDEVLIYVDGVPLNIAEGGGVDISTLPLGDVERVEVYRGTTPLAFGEAALGGIVSITTRTPGVPRVQARAAVGSFGTFFGDVSAGGRVGRLRFYLGAHVYSSEGDYPFLYPPLPALPAEVRATRLNNDAFEGNGVLRLALTLNGRRTLSLGAIGFGREQGLPGPLPPASVPAAARFHSGRGLGYLRYESRDDLGPGGRLSAQAFVSVERDRVIDPAGDVFGQGDPLRAHETTVSTGVTAYATRPLGEWGRAAAILEARRETYTPDDELDPTMSGAPARRLVGVAGGELDLRWRRLDLHVIPSARVELMSDVVTGVDTNGRAVPAGPAVLRALPIYRLGLVRPLNESATFKANIGRYQRAPSFLELYGNGNDRLLGDPGLLPERGTNADLALWIDHAGPWGALLSRTTIFGALADDLIYWLRSSGGPSRAENLTSARIYGLEQELRATFGRHLRLVGQGTITVAEDESDLAASHGKQIAYYPRYLAYGRPELTHVSLPAGLDLAAYVDAALFAGAYTDPAEVRPIPAQLLIGAGLSLFWPSGRLRATLSALNLGDLQATWVVGGWPLPGRTLFLALAYDGAMAGELGGSPLPSVGNP
jgi:outer membrane receptor protein involved in Fe transport